MNECMYVCTHACMYVLHNVHRYTYIPTDISRERESDKRESGESGDTHLGKVCIMYVMIDSLDLQCA